MHYGPIMIDLEGTSLTSEEQALLQHPRVGGVLLFKKNYQDTEQLKQLIKDIRAAAKKPLLIAVDHEGGRVWRFQEGFTKIPAMGQFGAAYDRDPANALKLAHDAGWIMAAELLDCGVDLSLAPVLDLDKGLSKVIGDRSFHRDPEIIVKLAKAFIDGMNKVGMSATGKHFPGHGGTVVDSHLGQPIDRRSLKELLNEDIIPFQKLQNTLGAIMPAHIIYPEIDAVPAGFSETWLQEILRKQLGFQGAIISDCLSMKGAAIGGDFVVRTRMALDAGCDMVILSQQERSVVAWVLDNLARDAKVDSQKRLAALVGKFDSKVRQSEKPILAEV